ncbi:hypothetical protein, partial [Streptomyces europaeiscabiei]|uniref:hypothetical protein n=1 Tax=Streptomyces europaeiscabiei TaxID=146819 RepID=UPI001ABFBE5F
MSPSHLGRRAEEEAPGKLVLDDGQVRAAGTLLLRTGTRPRPRTAPKRRRRRADGRDGQAR